MKESWHADRDVLIGHVIGVHGVRGELKVAASADELRSGLSVTVRRAGRADVALRVETVRAGARHLLVRIAGLNDTDTAADFRGAALYAAPEDLPALAPLEYRVDELVGMTVVDESMGNLGEVVEIARYPACDMLLVGRRRLMVPLLTAYGVHIDRGARTIATALPPGYEDLA